MIKTRLSTGDWKRIVRKQRVSGLTAAAFCRQAGVPQAAFYFWRSKLQRQRRSAGGKRRPRRSSFVEMMLPTAAPEQQHGAEAAATSSGVELRLPRRRRVIVRPGFDRRTLVDLLAVLEGGA